MTTLQTTIDAIRELGRLAQHASDPLVANYARAFFEEYGRAACTVLADIQRHAERSEASTAEVRGE
jgi:hypothetical protein